MFKRTLCNKSVPLLKRLQLFDSTVTPAVLYGSGTWVLTVEREAKLRKCQRQMLRTIFQQGRRRYVPPESSSDSDRTSQGTACSSAGEELEPWSEWIRRTTHEIETLCRNSGLEDWLTQQRRRLFRWIGHVARREDGRWSTILLQVETTVRVCANSTGLSTHSRTPTQTVGR